MLNTIAMWCQNGGKGKQVISGNGFTTCGGKHSGDLCGKDFANIV